MGRFRPNSLFPLSPRARPMPAQAAAARAPLSSAVDMWGPHVRAVFLLRTPPPPEPETLAALSPLKFVQIRPRFFQLIEGFCSSWSPLSFPSRNKGIRCDLDSNRVRFVLSLRNRVRDLPDSIPPVWSSISSIRVHI